MIVDTHQLFDVTRAEKCSNWDSFDSLIIITIDDTEVPFGNMFGLFLHWTEYVNFSFYHFN